MGIKHKSPLDNIIEEIEYAIDCIYNQTNLPSKSIDDKPVLDKQETKISEKVMRINHMGEICAQGLYRGQAANTKDPDIKDKLHGICREENEHLKLCNLRLKELNGRQSVLNPLWYLSSLSLLLMKLTNYLLHQKLAPCPLAYLLNRLAVILS